MSTWLLAAFVLVLALPILGWAVKSVFPDAFTVDPTSEAARALARKYLEMGHYMEAKVVVKKGLMANPNDCELLWILAQVYDAEGRRARAVEQLKRLLAISPDHADARALYEKLEGTGGLK